MSVFFIRKGGHNAKVKDRRIIRSKKTAKTT